MANRRWAVALTMLVAILVVACQPASRTFQTTLRPEFNDPMPVTLTDETGLVSGIAEAEVDAATFNDFSPRLRAVPNEPNASVLTWIGGMCDTNTTVRFHVLNGGYVLNLANHVTFGTGCPAAAVPRALRIETSSPIPVDSVTVAGG
jgi:hypothetical protein